MYTHQALLSASCRRRAVAARPKNMTIVAIMLLISKSLTNEVNVQLATNTISIHHQNSERRLRPLKSRMRLEASLTASTKPSCGNALISLLDYDGCPTVLVFNLTILDTTKGVEEFL